MAGTASTPNLESLLRQITRRLKRLEERVVRVHNHDSAYSPLGHAHDERYYTETEANDRFWKKLGTGSGQFRAYEVTVTFNASATSDLPLINTPFTVSPISVGTAASSDIGVSTSDRADGDINVRAWSRTNTVLTGTYTVKVHATGTI